MHPAPEWDASSLQRKKRALQVAIWMVRGSITPFYYKLLAARGHAHVHAQTPLLHHLPPSGPAKQSPSPQKEPRCMPLACSGFQLIPPQPCLGIPNPSYLQDCLARTPAFLAYTQPGVPTCMQDLDLSTHDSSFPACQALQNSQPTCRPLHASQLGLGRPLRA